ncbi:MAG: ABC transporter substrate-binding protein [Ideonella sp.]|nr:ABC transporter substrate-binding protein [Ideonella sp.]
MPLANAPHRLGLLPTPPGRAWRWTALLWALCTVALAPSAAQVAPAASTASSSAPSTVRVAFHGQENGFDPAQISDVVSAALVGSLFDALLTYDHLARPARLKPNTAVSLPEVSDNYTRFVFRIKPGITFSEHPAFRDKDGRPVKRELVAADYVYSIKRYYDPAVRSPTLFHYQSAGLLGLDELRQKALDTKTPFPYDTEVEGVRALDRYTLQIRVAKPAPRLPYVLATPALSGALAREVIESLPDTKSAMEHPVGTGPFKLGAWRRGSRIVLERNPAHQHSVHDEQPAADDAEGQAIAQRFRGRKLPLVDRVEISIIEEAQPRWLAFLNGELDMVWVPDEFVGSAAPQGQVAPFLAKRGVRMTRVVAPTTRHVYFNLENPVVGGYTPDKVALRRALALAYNSPRERALMRRGQMKPAQSVIPPQVSGYDPTLKSEMSDYDPQRAKALLDLAGYVDKDGDGWRDQPNGQPLQLELHTEPTQLARQWQGHWKSSMDAIGVKMSFRMGAWQENIKASRAGKLMMWTTGWSAAIPDGSYFLDLMYGPNKGQSNYARFDLPAFNTLNEQQRVLPDGPERQAVIDQAVKLSLAYMPYKASGHDVNTWLMQPRVQGFRPHPFMRDFWRFVATTPISNHSP